MSPGTHGQLRVVLQVRSESSQVRKEAWRTVCRTSEVSRVCTKHSLAIERDRFLGSPKLFTAQAWARWQSHQVDNCDRAGLAELRPTVIRLRIAEAQQMNPDDKKHQLLRSGEVKWSWRCGARVERNSAPRLFLKTACSGAPRTKEYERALALLAKGKIRRALCF